MGCSSSVQTGQRPSGYTRTMSAEAMAPRQVLEFRVNMAEDQVCVCVCVCVCNVEDKGLSTGSER
jgi:hypothetical protein